jgi:hypothetical protein
MSGPRLRRSVARSPRADTSRKKRSTTAADGARWAESGCGFMGMRFSLAGIPCSSGASRRASAVASFTPAMSVYSKKTGRWRRRSSPSSAASGKRRLSGTSRSRTSSVVAWSDTARFTGTARSSGSICGTTPTVDTVTRRGAMAKAFGCSSTRTASITAGRFSSGSPMPMNTTFVRRRPGSSSSRMRHTWSTISPARRLRAKPSAPVAQKLHASGQPTWVETHSVVRSSSGISTASTSAPSRARSAALSVPSRERCTESTSRARASHCCASRSRSSRPRSVIAAKSSTPRA